MNTRKWNIMGINYNKIHVHGTIYYIPDWLHVKKQKDSLFHLYRFCGQRIILTEHLYHDYTGGVLT